MKITCIDDKGRPPEIPIEKWVVKGTEYTPIFWSWHDRQGYVGVELAEITLDESNATVIVKDNQPAEVVDK